jgi:hypothetical protein
MPISDFFFDLIDLMIWIGPQSTPIADCGCHSSALSISHSNPRYVVNISHPWKRQAAASWGRGDDKVLYGGLASRANSQNYQGYLVAGIALWHSCHAILSPFGPPMSALRHLTLAMLFPKTPRHTPIGSIICSLCRHLSSLPVVAPRLSPFLTRRLGRASLPRMPMFGYSASCWGYECLLFFLIIMSLYSSSTLLLYYNYGFSFSDVHTPFRP